MMLHIWKQAQSAGQRWERRLWGLLHGGGLRPPAPLQPRPPLAGHRGALGRGVHRAPGAGQPGAGQPGAGQPGAQGPEG